MNNILLLVLIGITYGVVNPLNPFQNAFLFDDNRRGVKGSVCDCGPCGFLMKPELDKYSGNNKLTCFCRKCNKPKAIEKPKEFTHLLNYLRKEKAGRTIVGVVPRPKCSNCHGGQPKEFYDF